MIKPSRDQRHAGKERVVIKQALADFKKSQEDGGNEVELQNLIEQACFIKSAEELSILRNVTQPSIFVRSIIQRIYHRAHLEAGNPA
jgi:hypothetical protein